MYPILQNRDKQTVVTTDNKFKGKPFYCWDTDYLGLRDCCFIHMVGLPKKDGETKPFFPYEATVLEAVNKYRHVWVKKATGLGISEFFLYYMPYLCVADDRYQGCQMCIVTGPNIDLSKKLIRRMKNILIQNNPDFPFQTQTDYVLEINGCWIQAYPSHNLGSFRSLDKPKVIFLDEADFFPVGQLQDVRDVSERYIAKSNPLIVMVSTPNKPGGLFEQIETEKEDECLYKRIFLDYKVGENLIYTEKDIAKAQQSPSFEREYNLKYGYGLGNVFVPREIDQCLTSDVAIPNPASSISMGIDPGFGSSKFGITLIQVEDNILKVLFAKEYDRPSYETMIQTCVQLRHQYKPHKIYVDGAKPDFIKSLKIQFNESVNYESIVEQANKDKIDYEYRMYVVPINFNEYGKELLGRFQRIVSKGWFSISEQHHKDLVLQMRMAKYKENGNLDKDETTGITYDAFDSCRLALKMFDMGERV